MFPHRQILRSAPRFLRAPLVQRRLMSSPVKPGENLFIKEREAVKAHAASTTKLWKQISIYGCIPFMALAAANAYWQWSEHWEHWSHMPPLEERTEYPYQNIRTKNFPWGNGDKTLFWNDSVNYHNRDKTT